jgi:hypothetical protein
MIFTIMKRGLKISGRNWEGQCWRTISVKVPPTGEKKIKKLTRFGKISINNQHPFSKALNGFQVSPRMQELMVYAGQLDSYERCNEVISEFINIEVSVAQVYRLTDAYGKAAAQQQEANNKACTLAPVKKQEVLYAQADGSMLLTREEGWKEVKVGRVFKSSDCLHAEQKAGRISHSHYVAHLGNSKDFTHQMEEVLELYAQSATQLIFVTDGAIWLKHWIEDAFPKAVSILDYPQDPLDYHVCEHLHQFSSNFFSDKASEKQWVNEQKGLLLQSEVLSVIQNIEKLAGNTKEAQQLIAYYESNKERMDYKRYKEIGCGLIGSGAIESAHRTVVQKRMKQSGQRWSIQGAQHMLNLRVIRKNQQWHKIIKLAKHGFEAAA